MGFKDFLASKVMPSGGIGVDEALALLSKGGVLVDVRTLDEYVAGHAPGSKLVDPRELAADAFAAVHAGNPLAEPDGTFVLICDSGLRSGHLVPAVREQGHSCEFVAGGLRAWKTAGQFLLPGPPRR
ncbi:rhodanese-like domain-containing protein [Aestuariimicrobium soli]|uniref:rhodanese-like domain-containing protein n=1 Tax=Aestuariimicrobium soli TaxID=2035834 RepID=UPI003EB72580